jgi:uncharacterized protein (DUF1330 family)
MSAYWLARSLVNNPELYKRYTDQVPDIVAAYGGKILARGGKFEILEGPEKFKRFVVIEFPSLDQARACFQSQRYQDAARWRRQDGAGEVELTILESLDA